MNQVTPSHQPPATHLLDAMHQSGQLPAAVRVRRLPGVNGLDVQVLEAGFEPAGRPCVLLLHGFPELAFSWRRIMQPLAEAGYHVVAPDQRGYGGTTGWTAAYEDDLAPFGMLNLARDAVGVLAALGVARAEAVVGHDFGASVAAWCALLRPDLFARVALMSAPFAGPPTLSERAPARPDIHAALAALPRPRKHYQRYYATPQANADMHAAPQGVHDFLRAYFHMKSADWPGNAPHPLPGWTAEALAVMPTYYIMDLHATMAETVAPAMPGAAAIAACRWLPDAALAVYAEAFARTGFQGGLNWYRARQGPNPLLELFAGRTIEVPALFVAGAADWGTYQVPGALERMRDEACARMTAVHLVEGAGHWVQQEQPQRVAALLLAFLAA
jgi:pimeloyl-ACP methyl ester carboxylesterase